jgi:formate dehydrogenase subunit gamma
MWWQGLYMNFSSYMGDVYCAAGITFSPAHTHFTRIVSGSDMTNPQNRDEAVLNELIAQYREVPGGLLPLLHAIQDAFGYVPSDAIPQVAQALQQTRADIHGVISFYQHFRTTPPGTHTLQLCRAEACQARGGRSLEEHVKGVLGVGYHQTTADQEFSLEPVYCLGNCACGPSIQLNDEIYGQVDTERFDALVDELTTHVVEVQA